MIKVGILGAGFMGGMHASVYSLFPDVKIGGICDVRGDRAKSLAEKHKTIPFYNPEDLLKRQDITLVDVCLPTDMHREFVVKAAEAGKDVICEKPIALTLEDADAMIEVCRRQKVRLMIAQVIRFWPEYRFLKDAFDRGTYGKLASLNMQRLSSTPTWGWQNWLQDESRSGSALVDLHIHDTDFILYLFGSKPVSVRTVSAGSGSPNQHVFSQFLFPGGSKVSVEGGWDHPASFPFLMAYTANFEKAVVDFNSRQKPSLTVYEASGKILRPTFEARTAGEAGGNISDLGGYFHEIRYFVEHITHNKPGTVVTPEDARESLALVLKERESADTGSIITFS